MATKVSETTHPQEIQQHLGARISLNGFRGTIKYVGSVENSSGVWLGVEWDDPERGKHDGKGYFRTELPGAASFIRPSANINWGCSLLDAVLDKYTDSSQIDSTRSEWVTLGSSNGTIQVEAVGLDKVRRKLAKLDRLRVVGLDECNVASAGRSDAIHDVIPAVISLDLSRNLIPNWDVIGKIVAQLPKLQTLTLNGNRMSLEQTLSSPAFLRLEVLQLNNTLIEWKLLNFILPSIPSLITLELAMNRFYSLGGKDHQCAMIPHSGLRQLNLDDNKLSSWENCMKALAPFPQLQNIVLSSNHLAEIAAPPMTAKSECMRIAVLSLTANKLNKWKDIDNLAIWLPYLQSLHFVGNPLAGESSDTLTVSRLIIARLPELTKLNGTQISREERIDAERYYMVQIEKASATLSDAERTQMHPRWMELCEKHGRPGATEALSKATKLASRLITINIVCTPHLPDLNQSSREILHNKEQKSIKILPTMTIASFLMKVRKSMNIPKSSRVAFWLLFDRDSSGIFASLDLSNTDRDVELAGVGDGSTVLCYYQPNSVVSYLNS